MTRFERVRVSGELGQLQLVVIDDLKGGVPGIEVQFTLPSKRLILSLMQNISWRGKLQVIKCVGILP